MILFHFLIYKIIFFPYKNEKGITSGFDCLLIYWDLEKKFPLKHVNLNDVSQKFIQGKLLCPPLIYSVQANQESLSLVSCETGHIFALDFKEPKKVDIYLYSFILINYLKE